MRRFIWSIAAESFFIGIAYFEVKEVQDGKRA